MNSQSSVLQNVWGLIQTSLTGLKTIAFYLTLPVLWDVRHSLSYNFQVWKWKIVLYINAILQMMIPSRKKGFIWSFLVSDWFWLKKIRVKVTRLHSSKHQLYRTSLNSCFWTYRILQNFARGPDKEKTSWLSLKKLKWYSWMRTCIVW